MKLRSILSLALLSFGGCVESIPETPAEPTVPVSPVSPDAKKPDETPVAECPAARIHEGNLLIASDEEARQHASLCGVTGDFIMHETSVTELRFPELLFISGNVDILNNTKLKTVSVPKLKRVKSWNIDNSILLTKLELNSLNEIEDDFRLAIISMPKLDLPNLTVIGGEFSMIFLDATTDIHLPKWKSANAFNMNATDVEHFAVTSLEHIDTSLTIIQNTRLKSIAVPQNLQVGGPIKIERNSTSSTAKLDCQVPDAMKTGQCG